MAEKLKWGTNHPGHLVYLLDLSESMAHKGRIDNLLDAVKTTADLLIAKSERDGKVQNRFSVTIIGYNSDVNQLFKGSIVDLDNRMNEIYEQGGEDAPLFDKTKEAKPKWQTYTAKAFRTVKRDIDEWMAEQRSKGMDMPVPIIIHITDGFPYESERSEKEAREDALRAAEEIKQITMPDGNPILFNIHFDDSSAQENVFPSQPPTSGGQKFLFEASSTMSDENVATGKEAFNLPTEKGCRWMASNVKDSAKLVQLITFGSSIAVDTNGIKEQAKPSGD
jgi:uncharacterized protein YegL